MNRTKKTPKAKLKLNLDKMWSTLTKRMWGDGKCAWCNKAVPVQSDHIASRGRYATRWNLDNCVLLCAGCHLFRKPSDPIGWSTMVRNKLGSDKVDEIIKLSHSTEKVDLVQVELYLEKARHDLDVEGK